MSEKIRLFTEKICTEPSKIIAITKLTKGPANATLKVPIAVLHSFSTWAIPPRKKSVILLTFTPSWRAIKEWPSSWSKTERNKSKEVREPILQEIQIGNWVSDKLETWLSAVQVKRKKIKSQLSDLKENLFMKWRRYIVIKKNLLLQLDSYDS